MRPPIEAWLDADCSVGHVRAELVGAGATLLVLPTPMAALTPEEFRAEVERIVRAIALADPELDRLVRGLWRWWRRSRRLFSAGDALVGRERRELS